jgi:bacteriorhodopsin
LHGLLLLVVIAWTYMTNPRRRIFHYFAISILTVTTIYYFIMASDLGGAAVPVEFREHGFVGRTRQVFYARWVGYFINFSLIFFALLLMSGVGWASILFTIGLVMLWTTMFLIGMFVHSLYKWGFFVIAILLYALIIWQTMGIARSYANTIDSGTHKVFALLTGWELFMMYGSFPLRPRCAADSWF